MTKPRQSNPPIGVQLPIQQTGNCQPAVVPQGTTGKQARAALPVASQITKRVVFHDYSKLFDSDANDKATEVARFHLTRGRIEAEWLADWFQNDIEEHGIATAAGIFRPRDGKAFMDNLELGFANSTLISVEVITSPDHEANDTTEQVSPSEGNRP
ncbi:MAG: hypothetical protein GY809_29980 [Planctomycetes bacterium]|nr:hypothetical protein [Planctomycetota bacterium]